MIKKHSIAVLKDKNGKNNVEFEINKDEKASPFVYLSMNSPDTKIEAKIDKKELYGLIFSIVSPEEQEAMIPVGTKVMRRFIRQHNVRAMKDIKKGEMTVVNCNIDIPKIMADKIEEEIKDTAKARKEYKEGKAIPDKEVRKK